MSSTTSVNCNQCGASLEVDEATRFVTCLHCGSKLEVKRSPTSAFTEVLERIDQSTSRAANDIELIRLEQELERLDREWQMKHPGASTAPTTPGGKAMGTVVLGAFMVLWLVVTFGMSIGAASQGAPAIFSIVTAGMGIFGLLAMGSALVKGLTGQDEGASFLQRRQALLDQIARRRSRSA